MSPSCWSSRFRHCTVGCWIAWAWFGLVAGSLNLVEAKADLLWLKTQTQPVYGWVVHQDSEKIQFRMDPAFGKSDLTATGTDRLGSARSSMLYPSTSVVQEFARDEVQLLVINIDLERLEKLRPPNWKDYRDYAEELSAAQADPAARELAVRLYLISASHGSDAFRESCLHGLCSLARTEAERQQWGGLRRLHGAGRVECSRADAVTAEQQNGIESTLPDANFADVQSLAPVGLRMIRAIRQQDRATFEKLAEDSAVVSAWQRTWDKSSSLKTLRHLSQLDRLNGAQLRMLLRLESALIQSQSSDGAVPDGLSRDWESTAQHIPRYTLALPSFENSTRFDPSQNIFRDGKWQR